MRRTGLIIIGWAVMLGLGVSDTAWAKAVYNGQDAIEVSGPGNTLASLAADIGKPEIFSYDSKTKTAVCSGSIFVLKDAELTLGVKAAAAQGQTLKMACRPELKANSRQIHVTGVFNLYNSRIIGEGSCIEKGKSYRLEYGACYDYGAKGGEIVDSSISSAGTGLRIYGGVRVAIRNLNISDCGTGLQSSAGGTICGLKIEDIGRGAYFQKSTTLRDCLFGNSSIRVAKTPATVTVTCVDCELNRNTIQIEDDSNGRVLIQWSQYVQLVDSKDYTLPGAYLRLVSQTEGDDGSPKVIKSNHSGEAWLDVPECIIAQGAGRGPGYRTVNYNNTLEINVGDPAGVYAVLKKNWACVKNNGLKFTQLGAGGFTEQAIEYRKDNEQVGQEIVNLCPNSSFELETIAGFPDYWYPRFFHETRKHGWGVLNPGTPDTNIVFYGIDRTEAFHGRNALQIPPGMIRILVRAAKVDAGDGQSHALSFYARSDPEDGEIMAAAYTGPFTTRFKIGRQWQRYSVVWKESDLPEKDRKRGVWDLLFSNTGKSKIWLDAVQLEKGEDVHPYIPDGFKAAKH